MKVKPGYYLVTMINGNVEMWIKEIGQWSTFDKHLGWLKVDWTEKEIDRLVNLSVNDGSTVYLGPL